MTPDHQLRLNDDLARAVYSLLANKSVGTPDDRVTAATELLDAWTAQTDTRPANDLLERLADYILFDEPDMLTESQVKRRFMREPSTTNLSD